MPKPKPLVRLIESPIDYAGHPPMDLTPEARTLVARAFRIAAIIRASHGSSRYSGRNYATAPCTTRFGYRPLEVQPRVIRMALRASSCPLARSASSGTLLYNDLPYGVIRCQRYGIVRQHC